MSCVWTFTDLSYYLTFTQASVIHSPRFISSQATVFKHRNLLLKFNESWSKWWVENGRLYRFLYIKLNFNREITTKSFISDAHSLYFQSKYTFEISNCEIPLYFTTNSVADVIANWNPFVLQWHQRQYEWWTKARNRLWRTDACWVQWSRVPR